MKTKINFKNFIYFFIVSVFVLVFFLINTSEPNRSPKKILEDSDIKHVNIAGNILKIDLAITEESRTRGLSGRPQLNADEAMLFVFDRADKYSFWMKDMNFPLDIIWIGEDLKVVYIKKNALPESYPESYYPPVEAKYVLEVVAGFSEKNNLREGDSVEFLP